MSKSEKPDSEKWKTEINNLPDRAYQVMIENGTEPAFSGEFNLHFENGSYKCRLCGNLLFQSNSKFQSSCGWPSFDEEVSKSVLYTEDSSFGMKRVEIRCSNCNSHLGHVFDDGPTDTKLRFCVNSVALDFEKRK